MLKGTLIDLMQGGDGFGDGAGYGFSDGSGFGGGSGFGDGSGGGGGYGDVENNGLETRKVKND